MRNELETRVKEAAFRSDADHVIARARVLQQIRESLSMEKDAIAKLEATVDDQIVDVIDFMLRCSGHVIVSGVGKSGIVARKIASTFSSIGTPAFFLHAGDACHGDLGSVTTNDILLALSASGESAELIQVVAAVKRIGGTVVSLTGNTDSTLARLSTIAIDVGVDHECDPFNCVPSASTTAMLALGDAIAVTLLRQRNFTQEKFSQFHPGGTLGKRLLWRVAELMHTGNRIPTVSVADDVTGAMLEMTRKRLGATFVVDRDGKFIGIFTDGDLRRLLQSMANPLGLPVSQVIAKGSRTIAPNQLASEALELMEEHSITLLPVLDNEGHPVGAIHIHDLIQAGFR